MAAKLGERNNRATCTDLEVVLAIELVRVHKLSVPAVAEKFEVDPTTVRRWLRGAFRNLRGAR